jgi:excisionase family DNA binding protein
LLYDKRKKEETQMIIFGTRMFSVTEVAEILGCSDRTIYKYLDDGRLHGKKIGKRWMITQNSLRNFIFGGEENKDNE